MRKIILLCTLCAQLVLSVQAEDTNPSLLKHEFQSELASQSLAVDVWLPERYDKQKAYPVLYTTSGSMRRELLHRQLGWLSHVEMGAFPQLIIVSVPDVEVETHLHPKNIGASGITHKITAKVLEEEIIPWVEKQFNTRPYRIIEGYSSYGNLPLYLLLHHPHVFNAYISVTPALALDQTGLVALWESQSDSNSFDYSQRFLFLSRGNFTENVKPMAKAKSLLEHNLLPGLSWQYLDQSQYNFLMPAVTDTALALQSLFADTRIKDFSVFKQAGVKALNAHFQKLEKKYGYAMDLKQTRVDFAFYLSDEGLHTQALSIMLSLVEQGPKNLFLLTRLASLQRAASKLQQARATLSRALSLAEEDKNQDAMAYIQQMLSELGV